MRTDSTYDWREIGEQVTRDAANAPNTTATKRVSGSGIIAATTTTKVKTLSIISFTYGD
jgi:hypothetical protein